MEVYTESDEMVHEQEIHSLMELSEISLRPFLNEEPDLYSISDAKVVLIK